MGLRFAGLIIIIAGLAMMAAAAVPAARTHGPSPEVADQQNSPKMEIYRLRMVNDANGAITGSRDEGKTWESLGHVTRFTSKVSDQGYTASKWAPLSAIAATAVNAIHVRTGYNVKQDKGVVFSILPCEMLNADPNKINSFLSPDSSIYTDIPAGTVIFGGHWAPILGNPVELETTEGLTPLPENYAPKQGDIFVVRVLQPCDTPQAFIFENRFGGFIVERPWMGEDKLIGQVLKPVEGIGRFTGSQYADTGRLRANHNGVICVSVSKFGCTGGFQIIPREHAMSPEMERARTMTQWMVIGPLDARDPSWEGVAPLFRDYLRPSWAADDWDGEDWLAKVTSRVSVDVRIKGGPWTPMPTFALDPDLKKPFPDWANTALKDVTHIRINLPVPVQSQQ